MRWRDAWRKGRAYLTAQDRVSMAVLGGLIWLVIIVVVGKLWGLR